MVDFYIIDKIERDGTTTWGYLDGEKFEVYDIGEEDTDAHLEEYFFVLVGAPNWNETMVTEEYNLTS